jgi:hypothetical protein
MYGLEEGRGERGERGERERGALTYRYYGTVPYQH